MQHHARITQRHAAQADQLALATGQTGTIFAHAQEDVTPDIVTIAKGLGGGYQPIGAVLLSARIYDAFAQGSGMFQHGHTYIGHPMAAAAADKVVEIMSRPGLMDNVNAMGQRLQDGLAAELGTPKAARAVGSAVGRNPVAVLIPCHRVIRESGVIGGYRWQRGRKMALLAHELGDTE